MFLIHADHFLGRIFCLSVSLQENCLHRSALAAKGNDSKSAQRKRSEQLRVQFDMAVGVVILCALARAGSVY